MMTKKIAGYLFGFGIIGAAMAQTSTRDLTAEPARSSQKSDTMITIAVLNQRVDEVNWQEKPFEEVVDWLAQQGPINVVPQWKAMELQGINRDATVNVRLRNTTVREVLDAALEWVREGDVDAASVTYQAVGNTLRISTKADFNRKEKFVVKVYDVTDILVRIPDFRGAPDIDIEQAQQGGGQGGGGSIQLFGGGGGGGQGDDDDIGNQNQEFETQNPALEALRTLIEDTIEPTTWDTFNGEGKIRVYNRQLVVLNSIEVHEKIGGRFSLD